MNNPKRDSRHHFRRGSRLALEEGPLLRFIGFGSSRTCQWGASESDGFGIRWTYRRVRRPRPTYMPPDAPFLSRFRQQEISILVTRDRPSYPPPIMRIPFIFLSIAVSASFMGCSSVEMPKGTSKGYTSARFVTEGSKPLPKFAQIKADVNGMIQSSIRALFQERGMEFRPAGSESDVAVTYLLIMQNNIGTTAIEDYFGYGREVESITTAAHEQWVVKSKRRDSFEAGTIVIDVLDAATSKLVYRGYAHGDIRRDISDEERAIRIADAVGEALGPFFR